MLGDSPSPAEHRLATALTLLPPVDDATQGRRAVASVDRLPVTVVDEDEATARRRRNVQERHLGADAGQQYVVVGEPVEDQPASFIEPGRDLQAVQFGE
jgi:hypothetical protein